jgi:hypothetical protein
MTLKFSSKSWGNQLIRYSTALSLHEGRFFFREMSLKPVIIETYANSTFVAKWRFLFEKYDIEGATD